MLLVPVMMMHLSRYNGIVILLVTINNMAWNTKTVLYCRFSLLTGLRERVDLRGGKGDNANVTLFETPGWALRTGDNICDWFSGGGGVAPSVDGLVVDVVDTNSWCRLVERLRLRLGNTHQATDVHPWPRSDHDVWCELNGLCVVCRLFALPKI